jgi:hypothetical protein
MTIIYKFYERLQKLISNTLYWSIQVNYRYAKDKIHVSSLPIYNNFGALWK